MKKIAICGTAPSSMMLVPQGNPDWEVWACSPGTFGYIENITRFFELHRWEPGQPWFSEGYCKFLSEFEGPVYMAEETPGIKNCTVLKVDELVNKYGPYFFTSTIAWMMAMAIEEGATTIGLFGVDMSATEEYGYQRAGCQFFAMLAKSKGIEVGVPPESDLFCPPPLYGVCEVSHSHIKMLSRQKELEQRLNAVNAEVASKTQEQHFLTGAIDNLAWTQNTWVGNKHDMSEKTFVEPPEVPALEDLLIVNEGVPMTASEVMELTEDESVAPKPGQVTWVDNLEEAVKGKEGLVIGVERTASEIQGYMNIPETEDGKE